MKRAVAIVGDSTGYTGTASVTFSGLSAVPWLQSNGSVNVVERIPDQYPLTAPQAVFSQAMSASGGSVTVPLTFQATHDAFAIYLTPSGGIASGYNKLVVGSNGLCADVFGNSGAAGAKVDQWTCNGQADQEFQFVPVSGGYGVLQAGNSGDDVTATGTSSGTPRHCAAAAERRLGQPLAAGQAVRWLV